MAIEERGKVMLKEKIKYFFSYDKESPIEREVRRRLTWRVIMLSLSPVPLLLLLIYFIYCLAISNHESIVDIYERNVKFARRLKSLEEEIRQIRQRLNHDVGESHTNSYEGCEQAYLEIRSACPVIRHPLLNGGTVGAGEFLGFSFGASKNIDVSNFETNGNSLVVCRSLDHPYMEWFDRVSLWHNQDHRLYRIDVQGQTPEDFSARQRYVFYNALTNDLGKGFGISLTRLPYRPDMPYDATGTVAHLQFHVNIGRKNCRMSIVSHAPFKKSERGSVTLSDGMIKINAEDL